MALATTRKTLKFGRGVEFTYEALLALIEDRFPNAIDWDTASDMGVAVDADPSTGVLGLYFTGHTSETMLTGEQVCHPFRYVGEGAPIPVVRLDIANVRLEPRAPRCGFGSPIAVNGQALGADQCTRTLGHDGDHHFK